MRVGEENPYSRTPPASRGTRPPYPPRTPCPRPRAQAWGTHPTWGMSSLAELAHPHSAHAWGRWAYASLFADANDCAMCRQNNTLAAFCCRDPPAYGVSVPSTTHGPHAREGGAAPGQWPMTRPPVPAPGEAGGRVVCLSDLRGSPQPYHYPLGGRPVGGRAWRAN